MSEPARTIGGEAGGAIQVVSAASRAATLDDWDIASHVKPGPDRSFIVGRYVHGGNPPNRNGHVFRLDQLPEAMRLIPHAPLDMLHDPKRIVGTFAAATMVHPTPSARQAAPAFTDAPYVKVLAAVWSYHYPREAQKIRDAYESGTAFLSHSCLPEAVQCPTCGHRAPWDGYTSELYCDHMQGVNAKEFDTPWFLGGGVIIPPIRPGWGDAYITQVQRFSDLHNDKAQAALDALSDLSGNASPDQLEAMAMMLLQRAYPDHPDMGLAVRRHVAPGFEVPVDVVDAAASAVAGALTGEADAALAEALAGGWVEEGELAALVDMLDGVDDATAASLGGDAVKRWAEQAWLELVGRAVEAMAEGEPTEHSLSDGSFRIETTRDLIVAARAWGRARDRGEVKRHMLKRASELGADRELVDRIAALGPSVPPSAAQTGVIVAIVPPAEFAEMASAVGDQPASEIHMTLAYLGDVVGGQLALRDQACSKDTLAAAVAVWSDGEQPFMAATSGVGEFIGPEGKVVTYLSVDAPELPAMRQRLIEALDAAGVPISMDHGFTPHITLSYSGSGEEATKLVGSSWLVESVQIWWAGTHVEVAFG